MAVPAAVVGALKVALKKAAKKVAVEVGKEVAKGGTQAAVKAAAQKALEEVGKKAMTDAQAVILNRLKSAPSKALFEFASRELGLPVKEVRKIVKTFNQTAKMAELAKGQGFKEVARQKLKQQLKTKHTDRIKDILRKVEEYNAREREKENDGKTTNYNAAVRGVLSEIQTELIFKVHGISNAQNEHKIDEEFSLDVMKYFDDTKRYNVNNIFSLEKILDNLILDLERYETNSGANILLIEGSPGKWGRYDKASIIDFINDTKENVRLALG